MIADTENPSQPALGTTGRYLVARPGVDRPSAGIFAPGQKDSRDVLYGVSVDTVPDAGGGHHLRDPVWNISIGDLETYGLGVMPSPSADNSFHASVVPLLPLTTNMYAELVEATQSSWSRYHR
jgi:hypothetical protein